MNDKNEMSVLKIEDEIAVAGGVRMDIDCREGGQWVTVICSPAGGEPPRCDG